MHTLYITGTLPEEEMAYYKALQRLDAEAGLPESLRPRNAAEQRRLKHNVRRTALYCTALHMQPPCSE